MKESEEWDENKELMRTAISENPEHMLIAYEYIAAGYKKMNADPKDWNLCVDMYICGRDMVGETLKEYALLEDIAAAEAGSEADTDREIESNYGRRIEMDDELRLGEIPVQMIRAEGQCDPGDGVGIHGAFANGRVLNCLQFGMGVC